MDAHNTPSTTPCCVCGDVQKSARWLTDEQKSRLQAISPGTAIAIDNGQSLYLPSFEKLRAKNCSLCICSSCRKHALGMCKPRTPTQRTRRGPKKRKPADIAEGIEPPNGEDFKGTRNSSKRKRKAKEERLALDNCVLCPKTADVANQKMYKCSSLADKVRQFSGKQTGSFQQRTRLESETFLSSQIYDALVKNDANGSVCGSHYRSVMKIIRRMGKLKCALCFNSMLIEDSCVLSALLKYCDDSKLHLLYSCGTHIQEAFSDDSEGIADTVPNNFLEDDDTFLNESESEDFAFREQQPIEEVFESGRSCKSCYMTCRRKSEIGQSGTCHPSDDLELSSRTVGLLKGSSLSDGDQESESEAEKLSARILTKAVFMLGIDLEGSPGKVIWMSEFYASYVSQCGNENSVPVTMRTVHRTLCTTTRLSVIKSYVNGKGYAITSTKTASKLVINAAKNSRDDSNDIPAINNLVFDRNKSYMKLGTFFSASENKKRVREGLFSLSECLSIVDPAVFRAEMIDVETKSQSLRRKFVESCIPENEFQSLPVPFGTHLPEGENSLRHLTKTEFRTVVCVVFIMELKASLRKSGSAGPLQWGFGTALHMNSSKSVLKMGNHLGVVPSYKTLNTYRKTVFRANEQRPARDKIDQGTFVNFAWDNIDVRKSFNYLRKIGDARDWHGTLLMSQQTPGIEPIRTGERHSKLTTADFPRPKDMLSSPKVFKKSHISDFQVTVLGLIYTFRDNLLSTDENFNVSLDFILKNSLEFITSNPNGRGAACENLTLLSQPSNSAETAQTILKSILDAVPTRSGPSSPDFVGAVTADNPLFLQMIKAIYNRAPGERSEDLDSIIPQLGMMHCSMALFDTVKYLTFDSVLDGLVKDTGHSKSTQERFRDCKDFKSNLRFLCQATCAILIRIVDVLIEEGLHDENGISLLQSKGGDAAQPLNNVLTELLDASKFPEEYNPHFNLRVRRHFCPPRVIFLGEIIFRALKEKSTCRSSVNGAFFASIVLNLFIPALGFHFLSRCGHLEERNTMLTSLIPYVYCTRKINYQTALMYDLREKLTMPRKVHEALYALAGTCCNITGTEQNHQHNDEALESRAVLLTKEGAGLGTDHSVRLSFYTVNERSSAVRRIMDTITKPPLDHLNSFSEHNETIFTHDSMRASSKSVQQMYRRLSGNLSGTSAPFPFYGAEHQAYPTLINPISSDLLQLSEKESHSMTGLRLYGEQILEKHAEVLLSPWIDRTKPKMKWTTKHAVGGFAALRDLKRKQTEENRRHREKQKRKETVRRNAAVRALDLLYAQETNDNELAERIRNNIDLFSTEPHAFMELGTNEPKHTAKSNTLVEFQKAAGCGIEQNLPLFLMEGYPDLGGEVFAVAIDAMNFVHTDVNRHFSLTTRMHIESIAKRILFSHLGSIRTRIIVLDVHFDDPKYVPLFKKGEQLRRDVLRANHRTDSCSDDREEISGRTSILENVDLRPPTDWVHSVLANRKEKHILCNITAAFVLLEGAKMLIGQAREGHSFPIRVFGADISIDSSILEKDVLPCSLRVFVLPDGVPVITGDVFCDVNSIRQNALPVDSQRCYGVKKVSGHRSVSSAVRVYEDETARNSVGEGEIRMQSQSFRFAESFAIQGNSEKITLLQISSDSDNIGLALIAEVSGNLELFHRIIVKLPSRFADIRKLHHDLDALNISFHTFVRLFCLCGNDFCVGCNVASAKYLVATFLRWKDTIGDLSTAQSVQKLYYFTFLERHTLLKKMLQSEHPFFSPLWKREARMLIAYHPQTKSTHQLLPQDDDLDLQHRRVRWNVEQYWAHCTSSIVRTEFNCLDCGFEESGQIMLCGPSAKAERLKKIKALKPPACGCGKTTNTEQCCDSTKRTSCTCLRRGSKCTKRCGCPLQKCQNRPEPFASRETTVYVHSSEEAEGSQARAMSIQNIIHENKNSVEAQLEEDETNDGLQILRILSASDSPGSGSESSDSVVT